MKTLIAVPCMDYLEARFIESLIAIRPVGETDIKLLKGSLVYDARNQIMDYIFETDPPRYDYVLWLDSDMTFGPDLLERMFASIGSAPMLTGLCFGRRPPFKPCIFKTIDVVKEGLGVKPVAENLFDYPRDSRFEVQGCGFACVLQKVEMLDVMRATFGVPFFPTAGLGEDLTFCYRAKTLDYPIFCDSSIKLGHIMRMDVDEDFRDNVFQGAVSDGGKNA